LAAGGLSQ
jgi:bifunctional non-homologous end joining protein LigD